MNILANRWVSLFCFFVNIGFAYGAAVTSNWLFFGMAMILGAICFNNYLFADDQNE